MMNALEAQLGAKGHLLAFGVANRTEASRAAADIGLRYTVHHVSDQELEQLAPADATPLLAVLDGEQVEFLHRRVDFERLPSWLPTAMKSLQYTLNSRMP